MRFGLGRVLTDESDNHAVEVEEEHDEVETKLEERLLRTQLASCRSCADCLDAFPTFLWMLSLRKISVASSRWVFSTILRNKLASTFAPNSTGENNVLLCVPGNQRKVQNERQPVAVDEEQEGQESVDGGFGDNVGVEAVAEVDRVDVITAS